MLGTRYVIGSRNAKISDSNQVDATYVSLKSCPSTCPLKRTCYAKLGPISFLTQKLNDEAKNISTRSLAKEEAKVIDAAYNGGSIPKNRCLRLHVSGDTTNSSSVKIINNALKRWHIRGDNTNLVWGYTHAWDCVLRDEWDQVSMLASIDTLEQFKYAKQNGYACSLVVLEHLSNRSYELDGSDIKWFPCLSQVKGIACEKCRLCLNADRLYKNNQGIAFAAHGVRKNELKQSLNIFKVKH